MVDISEKLGRTACTELQNEYSKDNVIFHLCDVTKIEQLVSCTARCGAGCLLSVYNSSIFFHQKSAFARTKEEFGGIDIVCNNAGIGNEDKWRLMLDINLVR